MIKTVRDAWKIPELRNKILFTIFALLIFRLGAAIPVPYINGDQLETYLTAQSGTILGLMNAMSGSAFSMATLFALSVQPYINSSIIIQLLTVAIPALERLAKEGGEEGRKKIASITRYTTVAIGLLQGFGYYTLINSYGLVETDGLPAIWVGLVIVLSFTAGSAFLMWLCEQITEFGIGNGISILLFAGIVSRFPRMVGDIITGLGYYNNPLTDEMKALLDVETPKQLDNVETVITGSVRELCAAAAQACRQLGYEPTVLTDRLCCQAKEVGSFLASIAKSHEDSDHALAFLAGGETVVQLTGSGLGGRNQELALAAAPGIAGMKDTVVFSLGSDGTDGPTDAAGGIVDGDTMQRLSDAGLSVHQVLADNDAYHALKAVDGLLVTGPTGTNVNDVSVVLIKR